MVCFLIVEFWQFFVYFWYKYYFFLLKCGDLPVRMLWGLSWTCITIDWNCVCFCYTLWNTIDPWSLNFLAWCYLDISVVGNSNSTRKWGNLWLQFLGEKFFPPAWAEVDPDQYSFYFPVVADELFGQPFQVGCDSSRPLTLCWDLSSNVSPCLGSKPYFLISWAH